MKILDCNHKFFSKFCLALPYLTILIAAEATILIPLVFLPEAVVKTLLSYFFEDQMANQQFKEFLGQKFMVGGPWFIGNYANDMKTMLHSFVRESFNKAFKNIDIAQKVQKRRLLVYCKNLDSHQH